MKPYSQKSPEYVSRGVYQLGGSIYLTISAFKNSIDDTHTNYFSVNHEESLVLADMGVRFIETKEEGIASSIKAFPFRQLKYLYQEKNYFNH
ncbi:hypothetical protein C9I98_09540 [Photobacterium sanctipauli]|uniref:Uncharacterized protein n=1 Tax=Photobacterium sanctipauli TaxID=1342794 RepID=A0A2T3NVH8_9GAMM|nr:hypothetical protein C9I98_09540 [Photobacterium sanctipauli]